MVLCHFRALPILLFNACAFSFSVIACSVVQAQPKRPLTIPVKPTSSQQSAAVQPLPAWAEIRRDLRLGTITFLKAPNLSEHLEHDPDFAQLQANKQFGDLARAFIHAYRANFRLTQPTNEFRVQSV